jgi:hypothetical protein
MTVPLVSLRDTARRLRELEDAIAAQRKLIAMESGGCDGPSERAHLTRLLSELDQLLAESKLAKEQDLQEESLDRVMLECPL